MLPVELLLLLSLGTARSLAQSAQQITYYSDVPLYSSLRLCASVVCDIYLSNIVACGHNTSPVGPYASCACLKQQNSASITGAIKTGFREAGVCGQSATDDLSSVLAVFSSWCAAVAPRQAAVTVTSSATSGDATATPGSALVSASTPTSANSPTSENASGGNASNTGTKVSTGAIIGIVAGASLLIVATLVIYIVVRKRKMREITDPRHELQRLDGLGKNGSSGQAATGGNTVIYNNYNERSGAGNRNSTVAGPVPSGHGNLAAAGLIRSHR